MIVVQGIPQQLTRQKAESLDSCYCDKVKANFISYHHHLTGVFSVDNFYANFTFFCS